MRSTALYAPEGMAGFGRHTERFDDGLVHNHHWAVTADDAYPSHDQGAVIDSAQAKFRAAETVRSHREAPFAYDRHDDGLVHNHAWAVSGE